MPNGLMDMITRYISRRNLRVGTFFTRTVRYNVRMISMALMVKSKHKRECYILQGKERAVPPHVDFD